MHNVIQTPWCGLFFFFLKCMRVCVAEISNLLVVTKDRAPAPQTPMQESQLSFHRILKEEIEQVHLLIIVFFSYVLMVLLQFL